MRFLISQSCNTHFSMVGNPILASFLETPNFIPTVTKVSSDLALFASRSSSTSIASCITTHNKPTIQLRNTLMQATINLKAQTFDDIYHVKYRLRKLLLHPTHITHTTRTHHENLKWQWPPYSCRFYFTTLVPVISILSILSM